MSNGFVAPAPSGNGVNMSDLVGSLLVIDVVELIDHVQTVHTVAGEKTPAVRATVHVLDGDHAGDSHPDALIFPRRLQRQLAGNVGNKVLGRLGRGAAAGGLPAPYELAPATAADQATAEAWAAKANQMTSASTADAEAPF